MSSSELEWNEERMELISRHIDRVNSLTKKDMSEIRCFNKAPACVIDVLAAVIVILGQDEGEEIDWPACKRFLGRPAHVLMSEITQYRDIVSEDRREKARSLLDKHEPDDVMKANIAAYTLYGWVNAVIQAVRDGEKED